MTPQNTTPDASSAPHEDQRSGGWAAGTWELDSDPCHFDSLTTVVAPDGAGVTRRVAEVTGRTLAEAEASARLISAAPDMAEALKWMAAFAEVRANDDSKTFARVNRAALRNIAERARAALLKATGHDQ